MQAILKDEEIDFIYDLYRYEESEKNHSHDVEPKNEKLDSEQSIALFKPTNLT